MIKVTFPDGAVRDYAPGTTGTTVVESISPSLAKKTVAMKWNGVLADLADGLEGDGRIEFVLRDSADGLGLIRHDAAHVLAEAVQELWPDTQVTIGPVIENGFYYDFKRDTPFSEEDFPVIEKKMAEIVDPRPWAVGAVRDVLERYPHIGAVLPALGYSEAECAALARSIGNAAVDAVIAGTPIDLSRVLGHDIPVVRARYDFVPLGTPSLEDWLAAFPGNPDAAP